MAYTYILKCSDQTLYTGWTTDLKRRIEVHNSGKGSKYTRARLPVKLFYSECFSNRNDAMKREAAIKKMTKKQKLKLRLDASNQS